MESQEEVCISDDNSDDVEDIPDVATCQKLVEQFAELTNTDEACAQFYLQDREWDLERSVNAYFEAKASGGIKVLQDGDEPEVVVTFDSKLVSVLEAGVMTEEAPKKFCFMTWNIDGLDEKNLKKRTKAVARIIEKEKADIVFLQEAVPNTFTYLEQLLPQFLFVTGNTENYFTLTLLRRTTVYFDGQSVVPFVNTSMGRELLCVEAHIGDLKLHLLNSHLESTGEFTNERVEQLKIAFGKMKNGTSEVTTLFGGDLNLRDKEIMKSHNDIANPKLGRDVFMTTYLLLAGAAVAVRRVVKAGVPHGVVDLWEACGQRPECKWTWDTTRNTNREMPGRFKPRCRFDRVYLHAPTSSTLTAIPHHFGLVGLEKVNNTQSFPSDHWGIIVHFEIGEKGSGSNGAVPSMNEPSTSSQMKSLKRKR